MAGNYPDPPAALRLPWDRDGSVFCNVRTDTGGVTVYSQANAQNANNESTDLLQLSSTTNIAIWYFCIIFPALRDITHYAIGASFSGGPVPGVLQWSPDTTNGFDGTWNNGPNPWANKGTDVSLMRSVNAWSQAGVKAVRWNATGGGFTRDHNLYFAHFYGSYAAGQNPDRLRIWHPTIDQPYVGSDADFGNSPRVSNSTKQFRIKNNSAGLTANLITLSLEALTNASPTLLYPQHAISLDGISFAATQQITSLAPGAISGVLHVKRDTPSNGALGLWWPRLNAVAASWT